MNCQRIYARNFIAEMFGSVLFVISHSENVNEEEISLIREKYSLNGVVYWRSFEDGRQELVKVQGEAPEMFTVEEVAKFTIKPFKHPHGGLFLDARILRERLKASSCGEFLNLFSFTGSLSVSALLGGAESVINVDASKAALTWSKENHENNGVTARHIQEDALTFVSRASSTKFDCIIADPPSFGRFKNKIFSIKKDLPILLEGCSRRLKSKGTLILLYHTRDMPLDDITRYSKKSGFLMREILPQNDSLFSPKNGSSNIVIFEKEI